MGRSLTGRVWWKDGCERDAFVFLSFFSPSLSWEWEGFGCEAARMKRQRICLLWELVVSMGEEGGQKRSSDVLTLLIGGSAVLYGFII